MVTQSDKPAGPFHKILQAKSARNEESKRKPSITKAPPPRKDPYLEQEEMELARLSKLLGIDKRMSNRTQLIPLVIINLFSVYIIITRLFQKEVSGKAE